MIELVCNNSTAKANGRSVGLEVIGFVCCVIVAMSCALANAHAEQIAFDHAPHPFGGPAADTDFDYFGLPYWQLLADDFQLTTPATISRVNWWGFYDLDNPPATELFRLQVYQQREDAALPGEPLYTTVLNNPSRADTGRLLPVTVLPREFYYSSPLAKSLQLDAGVPYWLEITQIGDPSSQFRWEASVADRTGHAFLNEDVPDWTHTIGNVDLAFQLLTPEPGSGALLVLAAMGLAGRRRPDRQKFRRN